MRDVCYWEARPWTDAHTFRTESDGSPMVKDRQSHSGREGPANGFTQRRQWFSFR